MEKPWNSVFEFLWEPCNGSNMYYELSQVNCIKSDSRINQYSYHADYNAELVYILYWKQYWVLISLSLLSKKDSKDQESMQSSTTPVPEYQMGK